MALTVQGDILEEKLAKMIADEINNHNELNKHCARLAHDASETGGWEPNDWDENESNDQRYQCQLHYAERTRIQQRVMLRALVIAAGQ